MSHSSGRLLVLQSGPPSRRVVHIEHVEFRLYEVQLDRQTSSQDAQGRSQKVRRGYGYCLVRPDVTNRYGLPLTHRLVRHPPIRHVQDAPGAARLKMNFPKVLAEHPRMMHASAGSGTAIGHSRPTGLPARGRSLMQSEANRTTLGRRAFWCRVTTCNVSGLAWA